MNLAWLRRHPWPTAFVAAWTAYFGAFWINAVVDGPNGAVIAGHVNIWGDWALHFTFGSAMAYRELFMTTSPLLLGAPLLYPFAAAMVSAALIRLGVPFFAAFTVPSFVMSVALVAALLYLYFVLFGREKLAVLACAIFLLNGGLGFAWFIKDVISAPSALAAVQVPPRTYTLIPDLSIQWISVISSMIIPQRAFNHGFPLALLALSLMIPVVRGAAAPALPGAGEGWRAWARAYRRFALAGACYGLLPIVHTHSFLAVTMIVPFWFAADILCAPRAERWRRFLPWAVFGAVAFVIATPLSLAFVLRGHREGAFFRWMPGWYAAEDKVNWFLFWLRNWGVVPVAAAAGAIALIRAEPESRQRWRLVGLFAPFPFLFVAMNLVLFQPWIWDNTKILVWASVGISGLAAWAAAELWRVAGERRWARTGAALLVALMTASGAIDAYRLQIPRVNRNQMYSGDEIRAAEWVRKNTPSQSLWLTETHHNNWVFNLTGRRVLATFEGWLWTHGYNYQTARGDIQRMLRQPSDPGLYEKYGVEFAAIGDIERREGAFVEAFAQTFPLAHVSGNIFIFRVSDRFIPGTRELQSLRRSPELPLDAPVRPGWTRRLYTNPAFEGAPEVLDETTDVNFHFDAGVAKPFPTPCSMEFEGFFRADLAGTYVFSVSSDDGSWLDVGGQPLIDNGGVHMVQERSAGLRLGAGYHRIRLRYFDAGGGAILKFMWKSPDGTEGFDAGRLFQRP